MLQLYFNDSRECYSILHSSTTLMIRDGNSATGTEMIFYPWVALVPNPN
jgi:hypothetical protein